ncbi:MAG: NADP-dependent isocitrate dehydrogenase [Planctomycetota bacterium]
MVGQGLGPECGDVQGNAADLGGYFRPDPAKADAIMRPVAMFNELLEAAGV